MKKRPSSFSCLLYNKYNERGREKERKRTNNVESLMQLLRSTNLQCVHVNENYRAIGREREREDSSLSDAQHLSPVTLKIHCFRIRCVYILLLFRCSMNRDVRLSFEYLLLLFLRMFFFLGVMFFDLQVTVIIHGCCRRCNYS